MKLEVGDTVEWTSQSQGFIKTKTGTIIAIVPVNEDPMKFIKDLRVHGAGFGMRRNHESYIVKTCGSNCAYWPRVKHLKLV